MENSPFGLLAAVKEHASHYWERHDVPIVWPNESRTDDSKLNPWIYAEILPGSGESSLFGSRDSRHGKVVGILYGHVFVPVNTGTDLSFEIASDFGKLFEGVCLKGDFGACQFESVVPGGAGSGDDKGNWFRVSVAVTYFNVYRTSP